MKPRRDGMGVVFDIYEDQVERFVEISEHLRETDSKTDFEAKRCLELPELVEEGIEDSKWRGGDGDNGGGYRGHGNYSHNRQASFGGGFNNNYRPNTGGYNNNGPKSHHHSR
jgi:hypothetical protein